MVIFLTIKYNVKNIHVVPRLIGEHVLLMQMKATYVPPTLHIVMCNPCDNSIDRLN